MIPRKYESRISVRCYCEKCDVEYMTETPENCPYCEMKKRQEAKANKGKKGGGKDA